MNNAKIIHWTATGFAASLMLLSAIPDVLGVLGAISIIRHLGYPTYLLPFLGVAKTLGAIAIIVPRFRRLKEWAFAGLSFDVIGALYSHLSVGDPATSWLPAAVALLLLTAAYLSYRRQGSHQEAPTTASSGGPRQQAYHPSIQPG